MVHLKRLGQYRYNQVLDSRIPVCSSTNSSREASVSPMKFESMRMCTSLTGIEASDLSFYRAEVTNIEYMESQTNKHES
jgi:hypothetical protein